MTVATPPRAPGRVAGGPAQAAPPAWVPLSFLAASAFGLVLFGIAAALGADHLDSPTDPGMVSAVHAAMLGFLTTGVLGAIHQFGPVVGNRPLRSVRAAGLTLATLLPGLWTLAGGFAHGPTFLVPAGGILATFGVVVAAWNLSGPLSARGKGVPLVGLRLAVGYLLVTVSFGVVYAVDRNAGWFPLLPHRVLAHAHLGLLGWLGLAYVAVAEKLWPMFLLAHRPGARSGATAVALLGAGVPVLAIGLLFGIPVVGVVGGVVVTGGLVAHLTSLAGTIRSRRRSLELLHGFVLASAALLVSAIAAGAVAGLAPVDQVWRIRLVSAEVLCLAGWLGLALLGHLHKVVPFIVWTWLRATDRMPATGPALLFGDLFRAGPARVTLGLASAGFAALLAGVLSGTPAVFATGALLVGGAGAVTLWNLATGPRRALRSRLG